MSPLQSWAPELRNLVEQTKNDKCDITIESPTYIMKIDASVNMYHHFCNILFYIMYWYLLNFQKYFFNLHTLKIQILCKMKKKYWRSISGNPSPLHQQVSASEVLFNPSKVLMHFMDRPFSFFWDLGLGLTKQKNRKSHKTIFSVQCQWYGKVIVFRLVSCYCVSFKAWNILGFAPKNWIDCFFESLLSHCLEIKSWTFAYVRLLNKPYVNGVSLREQNHP